MKNYLFEVIAAVTLALGVAMNLELRPPGSAVTTVLFIALQPQSAMVSRKASTGSAAR